MEQWQDWLSQAVPTYQARVAVTLGLLLLLVVAGVAARAARVRVESETWTRVLNAGIGVGLLWIGGVVIVTLLSLWGGLEQVVTLLGVLDIQNPILVGTQLVLTAILIIGSYLLTGILKRFVHEITEEQTAITQHQTELVYRLTQLGLYVVAVMVVLGIWNVNLGGLLVGAGFLGIVLGLAARQTIGSLIAGFVLMFARPFEIGDWVSVGDREGIVTEISIINTRIQTFDGEYAMIPNDVVASTEVINRTRKGRLRVHVEVGVDYATNLDHATTVAREAMQEVEDILSVPQPQVVVKEFGTSAIILGLRFWIDKPSSRRRWRAQTAVIRAVKAAFDQEEIKIPFPQRELMARLEEGGFRLAPEEEPGAEVTPNGGSDEPR